MKTLKDIFFVTVPTLLMLWLILELVFRFALPACDSPNYTFDETYKVLKYDATTNTHGLYTRGRECVRMGKWSVNNEGWNSPIDYVPTKSKKRIAIIGDSFVEAFQVDNDKNFARLAANNLKNSEVYSFGISGAMLTQYLQMARYVNKKFDPDVLVFNIVHNDFDESITKYSKQLFYNTVSIKDTTCIEKGADSYYTTSKSVWLKKSALVRYLVNNINIESLSKHKVAPKKGADSVIYNSNANVGQVTRCKDSISIMLHYVMQQMKQTFGNKRVIFIMDAPRFDIYAGTLKESNIIFLNRMLSEAATGEGYEVIDLTDMFEKDYNAHHKIFNFPADGHWNEYGHQLVADTLSKYLNNHF
jgi:lysophospholipase L1-like esterase